MTMRRIFGPVLALCLCGGALAFAQELQDGAQATDDVNSAVATDPAIAEPAVEAPAEGMETAVPTANVPRDPNIGAVTQLPLPRYVSLKTNEGNARRGPGLTHRIDWVFTRAGMPLKVTAEYENWRRVEDADGAGGWVHYSLLSSSRTALVSQDMAEFMSKPEAGSTVVFQAEFGVIGRLLECSLDWCRLSVEGEKGWARKSAIWGVEPEEIIE